MHHAQVSMGWGGGTSPNPNYLRTEMCLHLLTVEVDSVELIIREFFQFSCSISFFLLVSC